MSDYDNTNRGVLFVNDRKEPGSNKPDRTGTLNVDGVEYFLDGWIKKSQAGASFLSVSVKRKDKQPGQSAPQQAPRQQQRAATPAPTAESGGWDDPSDIPF
jgi:hypothetical protein